MLKDENGKVVPFTMIPNDVLRSEKLDVFEKIVFSIIASFNPAYPSYAAIIKCTGLSRDRVWKSLRELEARKMIYRRKRGHGIEYFTWWDVNANPKLRDELIQSGVQFSTPDRLIDENNSLPDGPMHLAKSPCGGLMHEAKSPPGGL